MNTYGYVNQNPLRFTDPLGLQTITFDDDYLGRRPATTLDYLYLAYKVATTAIGMCFDDTTNDDFCEKLVDKIFALQWKLQNLRIDGKDDPVLRKRISNLLRIYKIRCGGFKNGD